MRIRLLISKVLLPAILLIVFGCIDNPVTEDSPPAIDQEDERIFIIDETGKRWDVTHAVNTYGMEANRFQFGLGPFAIKPLNNPRFVSPGANNYPDPGAAFLVIGTEIANEARAYPIHILSRFEVANDNYGNIHVAVGY